MYLVPSPGILPFEKKSKLRVPRDWEDDSISFKS